MTIIVDDYVYGLMLNNALIAIYLFVSVEFD